MPDFVARWRAIAMAALASLPVSIASAPALAIPEEDARKKLAAIPVFVLTYENGQPIPIPTDENSAVLPLYLSRDDAQAALASFQKNQTNEKAKLGILPLDGALKSINDFNLKLKDSGKALFSQIVSDQEDYKKAVGILKAEGIDEKEIQKSLSTPVFFGDPFLSVKSPKGPRIAIFFSYDQALSAMSNVKPQPKVAAGELSAVLQRIIQEDKDIFTFVPTPSAFEMMKESAAKP